MGTSLSIEYASEIGRVLFGGSTNELFGSGTSDPVVERIDDEFGDLPIAKFEHRGGCRRRNLIEMVAAVDDPGVRRTGRGKNFGHTTGHRRIGYADHLPLDVPGVRQRAEYVEQRRNPQLASDGRRVTHRRVKPGGQAEPDSCGIHTRRHPCGGDVERYSERFEDISRPTQ